MGYTTDFWGAVEISPPLNPAEVAYINGFSSTRRMNRRKGPYYVNPGSDGFGQDGESDIIDFNSPPPGQPGLWCQWEVSEDGKRIEWDGGEKFYSAKEWMAYIIDHFLKPGAIAKRELPFLQANHTVNGVIDAQGEDSDDRWRLVVEDNRVTTQMAVISFA
jgi:hypothetical protein